MAPTACTYSLPLLDDVYIYDASQEHGSIRKLTVSDGLLTTVVGSDSDYGYGNCNLDGFGALTTELRTSEEYSGVGLVLDASGSNTSLYDITTTLTS